jgi:Tfp pilus assembly protein PilO
MEKILKNIHWIIILIALYNIATYYMEVDDKKNMLISQQDSLEASVRKSQKTKKEIVSFYKDIDEAKLRIERVAQEIEKTQQLLPSEISDTQNISLLRKIAEDVNIKEVNISPEKEESHGFYIAKKYKFKAKATYLQFLIMFEKISEYQRILNVSGMIFKKLDQPQRSKFQLIDGEFFLETFQYNSSFKEDRGIDKIEAQFKNNAAGPAKHTAPDKPKEGN